MTLSSMISRQQEEKCGYLFTFTTRVDTMSFTELEVANRELKIALQKEYEDCFVELVPNVLANK